MKVFLTVAAVIAAIPCGLVLIAVATVAAPYLIIGVVCVLPFLMFIRKPRRRTRRRRTRRTHR